MPAGTVLPGVAPAGIVPPRAPGPFGLEMRDAVTSSAILGTLLKLAAVVAPAAVSALAVCIVLTIQESNLHLASAGVVGVPLFLTALFATLGGGVEVSATASLELFGGLSGTGVSAVNIVSLSTLVGAAAGVWWVARRTAAREPSAARTVLSALGRSLVEAGAIALVIAITSALARLGLQTGTDLGFSLVVQPYVLSAAAWAFVIVAAAAFLGRVGVIGSRVRPGWLAPLREVLTYLVVTHAPLALLSVILVFLGAARADADGMWLLWIPYGLNVTGLLFDAVQMSGISTTGVTNWSGSAVTSSSTHLWDLVGGWAALIIAVFVLLLIWLAVFIGVRRPRTGRVVVARAWQLPVAMFAVALAAAALLSASISVNVVIDANGVLAPSWEAPFLVFVFAAVVSLLAEVTPSFLFSLSPALLRTLGGGQAVDTWLGAAPAVAGAGAPFAVPVMANGMQDSDPAAPGWSATPSHMTMPMTASAPMSAEAGVAVPAPVQPMKPSTKRAILVWTISLAGVGAMIGAGFVAVGILNAQRDPAVEVRAYLSAIANGDADRATALLDPGLRNDARGLLTNVAFAGDSMRIVVNDVTVQDRSDSGASVVANYSLDGESFTHSFRVAPGPKEFLVLDTWKLDGSPLLAPVRFSMDESIAQIRVGDVSIDPHQKASDATGVAFYAYPGVYALTYEDDSPYFATEGDAELRVTDSGGEASAGVSETSAVRDKVLEVVQAAATACVTVPTNMNDECPYALRQTDLSALSLTEMATGFEDIGDGRFQTEQFTISTTGKGTTWNPDPTPRTSTFAFTGQYAIVDGELEITRISTW
ncbi:hypothetical protein [Microbacterium sp. ZW T5_56]|uniref:hypothetical protein n=1 Tax=Microbacterium sp. ZW T5_56 TaxID=3378081 RepID=UPI0038540606